MPRFVLGVLLLVTTRLAIAHQPTISNGSATSPEAAIEFDDIQISRVLYHEITDDFQQLWLAFEIDEPQSLFITLGVPLIGRLESFRPAFAVLGPGLPDTDLPFETPEGVGNLQFLTDSVGDPEVFNEPFSGTTSWILSEEDVDLPEPGTYYIVAYVPTGENGKLWIAPGKREEFTPGDFIELGGALREVRAFHELAPGNIPCFFFPVAVFSTAFLTLCLVRRRPELSQALKDEEHNVPISDFGTGHHNDFAC